MLVSQRHQYASHAILGFAEQAGCDSIKISGLAKAPMDFVSLMILFPLKQVRLRRIGQIAMAVYNSLFYNRYVIYCETIRPCRTIYDSTHCKAKSYDSVPWLNLSSAMCLTTISCDFYATKPNKIPNGAHPRHYSDAISSWRGVVLVIESETRLNRRMIKDLLVARGPSSIVWRLS